MTATTPTTLDPNPMTRDAVLGMANDRAAWCVTLACPLEPAQNDRSKVRLKLRHLVEHAAALLNDKGIDASEVQTSLAPLTALIEANETVPRQGRTLLAFVSPETQRIACSSVELGPSVDVSDRFEIGRLLAAMDSQRNYHVLTVADDGARLLHIASGDVAVLPLPLKREDRAAANAERVSPVIGGSAHANRFSPSSTSGTPTAHVQGFGHERRDEIERQTWYDVIADALGEVFTHNATTHLIVVTDVTHHGALSKAIAVPRAISFVDHNPAGMSDAEIVALTRETHDAHRTRRHSEVTAGLVEAAKDDRVCTDLAEACAAAANGRVDLLVVQPNTATYGKRIAEGRVELHDDPKDGDIDLVAALIGETLAKGGRLLTLDEGEALPVQVDGARLNAVLRW